MERHCPRCNLPESETDTCVNKTFGREFQCPEPVESDPTKDIHVACGPCGKRLILPIGRVMKGKVEAQGCKSDVCSAKLLIEAAPVPVPSFGAGFQAPPINSDPPPSPSPEPTAAERPAEAAPAPTPKAKAKK